MTSAAVIDLAKRLQDLESEAKLLRNDVANLEATKRNLAISESTSNRALEIQRHAAEEAEATESATSSKRRSRRGHTPGSALSLPLPQDFIDELTHKAGDLQSIIKKHRELAREKEDLFTILQGAEADADDAEQSFNGLSELAGVDEDGASTMAIGLRKKNEYNAALTDLLALYRERELLRVALQVQSAELGRISTLVEDTANAEEQKAEAIAVLAEKRAKLQEMRRERAQLGLAIRAKDAVLERKNTGPTKEEIIHSANYDRRVALYELEKEGEQLKMNDAAVRTRAMQIAKAEKRIEMIGDAVAGNGIGDKERVDVELMDELITETNALYNLHDEASVRMDDLDVQLEKIDYKIYAIHVAVRGTARERERIEKAHDRYMKCLQKEYDREQTVNAQSIQAAETEVDALKQERVTAKRASRLHAKAPAKAKA